MKRQIGRIATAVSLALCVGTLALWASSYFVGAGVERWHRVTATRSATTSATAYRGTLQLIRYDLTFIDLPPTTRSIAPANWSAKMFRAHANDGLDRTGLLAFELGDSGVVPSRRSDGVAERWRMLFVPLWVPTLAFAIAPARWWRSRRKHASIARRLAAGQCAHCGYDLRGGHARCPECGLVPLSRREKG